MRDPHPKFIPLWTKVVKKYFEKNPKSYGFSARRHIVDGKNLDWFDTQKCFAGEAFCFDREQSEQFIYSKKSYYRLGFYNGGLFDSLNKFYAYKARLYKAVQKFKSK